MLARRPPTRTFAAWRTWTTIRFELQRLRLLLGCQDRENVRSQFRPLDGGFGLRLHQRLRRRSDRLLVERNGLDCLALRLHRLSKP